jgi:hypothetical protein
VLVGEGALVRKDQRNLATTQSWIRSIRALQGFEQRRESWLRSRGYAVRLSADERERKEPGATAAPRGLPRSINLLLPRRKAAGSSPAASLSLRGTYCDRFASLTCSMNMKYAGTATISKPTANATPSINISDLFLHSSGYATPSERSFPVFSSNI